MHCVTAEFMVMGCTANPGMIVEAAKVDCAYTEGAYDEFALNSLLSVELDGVDM